MGAVDDRRGRRSLLLYFVVAYAFTWLLWVPPLLDALPRGWAMPSPDRYAHFAVEGFAGDRHLLLAVVFTVAVYGPLLGALIATSREQGAQGVRNLLAKTFNPRVAHRWYLVALIIAVGDLICAHAPGLGDRQLGPAAARRSRAARAVRADPAAPAAHQRSGRRARLARLSVARLQERFSAVQSVWLLGLAWAIWHYPLVAIYALSQVPANAPAPASVVTVVVALAVQTIGAIGLTYVYVWLFSRTRSIFLMIVFHALTNALPFLLPPALGLWALVVGVFPWLVVLVLWLVTRPEFLMVVRRSQGATP